MAAFQGFPHVLETQQFTRKWLEEKLFPLAREKRLSVQARYEDIPTLLRGKGMATLFYEPSTRTRLSFETAMHRLGGWVVSTENASEFSSAVKGETLEDTIRVLNGYRPAVIVLRHPEEGAAKRAARISEAAIINAGDGTGQHPTQALLDIFTIQEEIGRIDNISVALVGDLVLGRTVHSLVYLLGKFINVRLFLVSPPNLRMRSDIKEYLAQHDISFTEHTDLRTVASQVDVIYQTRTQTERGSSLAKAQPEDIFCMVDAQILNLMHPHSIIMHPLPRNEEISPEVDKNPRAAYFRQAQNGLYVRMALLQMILG
ncbi:MAG: aspartate carbamoyltransferase [bacterium]|nr:aspartate carbamoyltransferase [bacterium]